MKFQSRLVINVVGGSKGIGKLTFEESECKFCLVLAYVPYQDKFGFLNPKHSLLLAEVDYPLDHIQSAFEFSCNPLVGEAAIVELFKAALTTNRLGFPDRFHGVGF